MPHLTTLHALVARRASLALGAALVALVALSAPRVAAAQATDCSAYQFAKYGPMDEATFRSFYPTLSTAGMVCSVIQRGVSFPVTPEFEKYVNTPFPQPELIAALRAHGPAARGAAAAPRSVARPAATAVAPGLYACGRTSMRGTFTAFPDTRIAAGGRYAANGAAGRFAYDAATRRITWLSGVNAHAGWSGEYYPPGFQGMDVATFEVRPDRGPAISCKLKGR